MRYVCRELEPGTKVNLVYMSNSPPDIFTFQYHDSADALTSLMDEIKDFVATGPPLLPPESIALGQPVLAKFSEDELWYRGQVLSCALQDNVVEVTFVDYGNSESVAVSDILSIPPKFVVVSKQSLTCQMSDSTGCAMTNWSPELLKKFEELTESSEYLTATVVQYNHCHVLVSFADTCPDWANNFQ